MDKVEKPFETEIVGGKEKKDGWVGGGEAGRPEDAAAKVGNGLGRRRLRQADAVGDDDDAVGGDGNVAEEVLFDAVGEGGYGEVGVGGQHFCFGEEILCAAAVEKVKSAFEKAAEGVRITLGVLDGGLPPAAAAGLVDVCDGNGQGAVEQVAGVGFEVFLEGGFDERQRGAFGFSGRAEYMDTAAVGGSCGGEQDGLNALSVEFIGEFADAAFGAAEGDVGSFGKDCDFSWGWFHRDLLRKGHGSSMAEVVVGDAPGLSFDFADDSTVGGGQFGSPCVAKIETESVGAGDGAAWGGVVKLGKVFDSPSLFEEAGAKRSVKVD